MAAILINLSNLFGDWVHDILLLGSILSEFLVASGIILETPKDKTRRERLGMYLVIGGVLSAAIFTISLFVYDERNAGIIYDVAQAASRTAAARGVQVVQQQAQLDEILGLISKLDGRVTKIEADAGKPATLAVIPSLPLISAPGSRKVTAEAARIVRSTALPGVTVSIIPFLPGEPQAFADELAAALNAVPGAQVAVGHGNMIVNGQQGLIVQYDHSNPVSASVFNALAKAGLNPISGPPADGPVVYIKVAPP